jgi:hypothetical protein
MDEKSLAIRALIAVLLFLGTGPTWAGADECHPVLDPDRPQVVIGYGSLMEKKSKAMSAPTAGPNHPVRVTGFQRSWTDRGGLGPGFRTIFLGVEVAKGIQMVAVAYSDPDRTNISGTDAREQSYCRMAVEPAKVEVLDSWDLPADAEIWIYTMKPDKIGRPDASHPIVQSYVDVFLSGYLQMQDLLRPEIAAKLNFASECITTTSGWSEHWKNDRIYPRRPWMYQRNAPTIDGHLKRLLPEYFDDIRIE